MIFLFPFCTRNGAVETVGIFVLRFLLCWSSNFYIRLKVDSFPEKYQMTIMATIELLVNVGTMISPKAVQMALDNKMNPIVFMDVLRIVFGTLPVFLLNETKITLDEPVQAETAKKLQEIST